MIIDWTKNLSTEEEKTKFENSLLSAKPVLERLLELLKEREYSMDRVEMNVKSFDNPSWAYKQAFNNGFRSGLNIVKILINLDQQKEMTT